VAAKLSISVAHVEAGLRSGDRRMPEEINRLLTDQLADLLFTPSEDGNQNLAREGVAPSKVHTVGNVMIDTLVRLLPQARPPELPGLTRPYGLVTLHRPSNVDDPQVLRRIMETLLALSRDLMLVFPIHPRTRKRVEDAGRAIPAGGRLLLLEPIGYLEMLGLQRDALAVITDSGGIQEETTYLGVPCLTLRENTERPITVTQGTNRLFGNDMLALEQAVRRLLAGERLPGRVPPLWDGHAGERIASVLTATA